MHTASCPAAPAAGSRWPRAHGRDGERVQLHPGGARLARGRRRGDRGRRAPSHRRRGILSALMRRQLADIRERGEATAALFASESGIYGRYGYGAASAQLRFTIRRGVAQLSIPPGTRPRQATACACGSPMHNSPRPSWRASTTPCGPAGRECMPGTAAGGRRCWPTLSTPGAEHLRCAASSPKTVAG